MPEGLTVEDLLKILQKTKPPNRLEVWGMLEANVCYANGYCKSLGLVSVQKVTTAFANYVVDSLQNSTTAPLDVFKYHGSGTGSNAEANSQTGLITEVETRATGNQAEGSSTNIYKTIGTVTYTANRSIAEHGLFSANANGTLLDRSLLANAVAVENNDQIEWTYQLTVSAEA